MKILQCRSGKFEFDHLSLISEFLGFNLGHDNLTRITEGMLEHLKKGNTYEIGLDLGIHRKTRKIRTRNKDFLII